ncbi:glycerol-3-phosphate responsive antiterminator [Clostridium sp. AL.422]|uniref:glycerol-3-phosphate responsive antiterminator n=1 Tax=Clostridium TaxID=1485 RepID=UPI00293DE69A|nr:MULTISPECIES: glycerol-3-phosphate responsive antiterminator [unclassified Clostridium]MDV4150676.1 glycerol-3-phosphate responsive antiterminator [Clostridium sp. AL.422]
MNSFREILEGNPVVAAVKDIDDLESALQSDIKVIFVLFGNILNIKEISEKISSSKKIGILHIDLVEGLSSNEYALKFLKETTRFKGIISIKPQVLRNAKKLGFIVIQRIFMIDSLSKENMKNHLVKECDAVEILPGLLFKIIKEISITLDKPLISGGLISDKEDVVETLKSGATCISTTKKDIWYM